jgi:hypothetical protein
MQIPLSNGISFLYLSIEPIVLENSIIFRGRLFVVNPKTKSVKLVNEGLASTESQVKNIFTEIMEIIDNRLKNEKTN